MLEEDLENSLATGERELDPLRDARLFGEGSNPEGLPSTTLPACVNPILIAFQQGYGDYSLFSSVGYPSGEGPGTMMELGEEPRVEMEF